MNNTYIAVLGDLHGHITLAFRILRRWEIEHGHNFSAILQVGDFGAFPPPFRVDKATMRFYEKDPDELSFIDYYHGSTEAAEILSQDAIASRRIVSNLYFIKGNHEDFTFLSNLPEPEDFPLAVDAYNKLYYLPNGKAFTIPAGDNHIKVAALGGIAYNNQWGKDPTSQYYTKSEYRRLCSEAQDTDILLTHDVPFNSLYENAGSKDISDFLHRYQPKLHFSGHYHEPGHQILITGATRSFVLNAVKFRKPSQLNLGCIAIIEIQGNRAFDVSILNDTWIKEYRKDNFRYF